MSEHTPKDWTVSHPVNAVEKHVRDEDGVLICKCYWPNEDANAKLIAAAPMMLKALRQIVRHQDYIGGSMASMSSTRHIAAQAIQHAIGEA
jgi:hypothetical protein